MRERKECNSDAPRNAVGATTSIKAKLSLSGTGLIWGFNACIYCRKKMEIWSGVTIAGQTNEQTTKQKTRKEGATQPLDHGRLR